jgi:hypothetical protein
MPDRCIRAETYRYPPSVVASDQLEDRLLSSPEDTGLRIAPQAFGNEAPVRCAASVGKGQRDGFDVALFLPQRSNTA